MFASYIIFVVPYILTQPSLATHCIWCTSLAETDVQSFTTFFVTSTFYMDLLFVPSCSSRLHLDLI